MNEYARSVVKGRLAEVTTTDLFFCDDDDRVDLPNLANELTVTESNSLESAIEICLNKARTNFSVTSLKYVETDCGAARSVIDIWRHLKTYNPDLSIFDVMHTLYEMKDKLVGHFCNTIQRRVFKLKKYTPDWNMYPSTTDELGMVYDEDWKDI